MVFPAGLREQLLSQIQPESELVIVLLVGRGMSQIRLDQSAGFEGGLFTFYLSFWRPLKTTQKQKLGIKSRNLVLGWPDENWICLLHKHLLSSYLWKAQSAFGNQKMNKTHSLLSRWLECKILKELSAATQRSLSKASSHSCKINLKDEEDYKIHQKAKCALKIVF